MCGDKPVIDAGRVGGKLTRYARCLCDLHLYDIRSLGILASGHALANDGVVINQRSGGGGMAFESGKPHLRLMKSGLFPRPVPSEGYSGGALHVAVEKLAAQHQPIDLMVPVRNGDEVDVSASFEGNRFLVSAGQPVDLCYEMGQLPLHEGDPATTRVFDRAGSGRFVEFEDGDWWIEMSGWDGVGFEETQMASARLPLYGRNARRSDGYRLGEVGIKGVGGGGIGANDASALLLASLSGHTDLPIRFPDWVAEKIRKYQAVRFGRDGSFAGDPDFRESSSSQPAAGATFILSLPRTGLRRVDTDRTAPAMQLDLDMLMTLELRGPDGAELASTGTWKKTGQIEVPANRMQGVDGAREMFWNTLEPRFLDFYRNKKMKGGG
jgi:hypothetical protein